MRAQKTKVVSWPELSSNLKEKGVRLKGGTSICTSLGGLGDQRAKRGGDEDGDGSRGLFSDAEIVASNPRPRLKLLLLPGLHRPPNARYVNSHRLLMALLI